MVLSKRKRMTGRKPVMRKRRRTTLARPSRSYINNSSAPYSVGIKRKWWVANWTPNTTTTDGFYRNFTFSLTNVPNNSEFTNLFDFYKITGWLIELVPRYDGFMGNDTVDTTLPGVTNQAACRVFTQVDPKDTSAPTGTYTTATLNTFLEECPNAKVRNGNRIIRMYVKAPGCTDTIGGSTGRRTTCPWILTSASNVGFWGAKAFITDVNLTGTFGQSYDIYYTVYMRFKGCK